jgi:hypothetical protein
MCRTADALCALAIHSYSRKRRLKMQPPEQPAYSKYDKWFLEGSPFSPTVVLLELFRVAEQASALHASEDWSLVREGLSEQSRAEVLRGLRATQAVVEAMAESLESEAGSGPNYGIQR